MTPAADEVELREEFHQWALTQRVNTDRNLTATAYWDLGTQRMFEAWMACHTARAADLASLRQQLEQARVVLGFNRTALRIAEGAFMGVSDVFPAAGAMEHANRCGAAVDMIDALSQEDAK